MVRRRRANANREQMVKSASDITENLLNVTRMMNDTVGESAESLQSLGKLSLPALKLFNRGLLWAAVYPIHQYRL